MYLIRKYYITFKLVFRKRLKFWFSSPQTKKLHIKLPTVLVVYYSAYNAMQATNTRAKAETATKML